MSKKTTEANRLSLEELNKSVVNITENLNALITAVDVIIEAIGIQKLAAARDAIEIRRLNDASAKKEQSLDEAVEKGLLTLAEVSDDNTIYVLNQKNKEGKTAYPERFMTDKENVTPELGEKLLGKKVGDVVEFEDGTITILRLFNRVRVQKAVVDTTQTETAVA